LKLEKNLKQRKERKTVRHAAIAKHVCAYFSQFLCWGTKACSQHTPFWYRL